MQNSEKLIELIEQASLTINTISPADISEIENLQKILDQIYQSINEVIDSPVEILEQAKEATSDSVEVLQKILQKDIEDSAQSLEKVSLAIVVLQDLIEQVNQTQVVSDSGQANKKSQDTVEPTPQETAVIAEEDVPLMLDFVAEAGEHIESAETGLLELENKPDDNEVLNQIFRAFHTIQGMAGFLNLGEIGSLAHSAENLLDSARKGELILAGLKESIETGKPLVPQKNLPDLLAKLKNAVEGKNPADFLETQTHEGRRKDKKLDEVLLGKTEPNTQPISTKTKNISGDEKIKVSTDRLDNLINMAGELVIAQLMVTEEVNMNLTVEHELARKVAHQSKIVRELQELSMSMRMVPIHGVFQKMARLVRDLSRKADKDIMFTTFGEDTELDRSIVDKIANPLVHMVRNSVDHGIETKEERAKAGKDPAGHVELRAFHQAGNIVIEIQDDGKGLDKERILKKAIDNGVIDSGQELSDEEIFKLIFHAGLSTAQKITSISGRGVGMDVVKKNIESLRGRIDISSEPGKGTTFTIRLPLTLAIIDGQVVKIGEERYIIPINSVVRSLRPNSGQLSSVQNLGEMVMVRGKLLPLVRLYKLFKVVPTTEDPTQSLLVVVEEDNKKCCLLVDELLGQQQVVIKSLGEGLGKVKGISGGAIMGDGRARLILDIPGLMEIAQS
jgi:two-component system chemotaxis sensor kinase CheA